MEERQIHDVFVLEHIREPGLHPNFLELFMKGSKSKAKDYADKKNYRYSESDLSDDKDIRQIGNVRYDEWYGKSSDNNGCQLAGIYSPDDSLWLPEVKQTAENTPKTQNQ